MISVLIITRDRPALLQKCLASLERELPANTQVVVVINGPDVASAQLLESHKVEVLTLAAPETPGKARNHGLGLLRGEWTFLVDDDAELPPGYYERWLKALERTPHAQVIGGPDQARPDAIGLERAVSLALSSKLCAGGTYRRHRERPLVIPASEVMLTSCNLWVRTLWWQEGLRFPENYRRGEETVLLAELRTKTPELWAHGELVVWHARRKSLQALLKASFIGGQFRAKFLREEIGLWWFWLPALFVILHASLIFPRSFAWLALSWLFVVLPVTLVTTVRQQQLQLWPIVVFLHWALPFSYGLGLLSMLVSKR
jgi:glycosyltransferase involved in cell wall biosynthesis